MMTITQRRSFAFMFLALVFSSASYAENCDLKYLEKLQINDIECQFYMGTKAFRNKQYSDAASYWENVIKSPSVLAGDDELKTMALGTTTYLTYYGLGVPKDRMRAVQLWKKAVIDGDFEARKHLGDAYFDNEFKNKNPVFALGWYESAIKMYSDIKLPNASDDNIYANAKKGALDVRKVLSENEVQAALKFSRSIQQY